jgi:hypothetical protein
VDGGVGVEGDCLEFDMGRLPHPPPHFLLEFQHLPGHVEMQRSQKTPEGALRRQPQHFQNPRQHRLALQELKVAQSREADVQRQNHGQHKPIHGHGPRDSSDRERLFHKLLKTELFQHRGHGQKTAIRGQVPCAEVIVRGRPDFQGLRAHRFRPLSGSPFLVMLSSVVHLLGHS